MSQSCKVCQLGQKVVKQLHSDYINGINLLQISKTYGISRDSVVNHVNNHLPESIVQGAKETLQLDSAHLVEQIDQLYSWMKVIFKRNYDKGYDKTALKALSEQRNTLQLLAQISVALHKTKVAEFEHEEKRQLMEGNIPLERLTKEEQEVYFKITQKLLGDGNGIIDLGYGDSIEDTIKMPRLRKKVVEEESKDGEVIEVKDEVKQVIEVKEEVKEVGGGPQVGDQNNSQNSPPPSQPEMTFRPIPKSAPVKDSQLVRKRRSISRALREQQEEERFPNTPGSPLF